MSTKALSRSVLSVLGVVTALTVLAAAPAAAVPDLQLYVENAYYDDATESWVTADTDFDIQIISANEALAGVKLAAALVPNNVDPASGSVVLDPVGYGSQTAFTYGVPIMGSGAPLPPHGIYPTWYTTLPVGDFAPQYPVYNMQPGESGSAMGQIVNVHVTISGFTHVHFDAYNHTVTCKQKVRFAPFSHDADSYVPEPGTLALMLSGVGAMFGACLRKRRTI